MNSHRYFFYDYLTLAYFVKLQTAEYPNKIEESDELKATISLLNNRYEQSCEHLRQLILTARFQIRSKEDKIRELEDKCVLCFGFITIVALFFL